MSIAAGQQIEILRAKIYQENLFDPSDEYLYEEIIKSLSWHIRQFEEIDSLMAEAERLRSKTNPYNEDGYCEHCGNGDWKAHAPNCGWADLTEERALADELAGALRDHECFHEGLNPRLFAQSMRRLAAVLARYAAARRG